jgi:hypothetical protein
MILEWTSALRRQATLEDSSCQRNRRQLTAFLTLVTSQGAPMARLSEEQIRQRAHQLWELAGRPEGREQEFWLEAERELENGEPAINPDEKPVTFLE